MKTKISASLEELIRDAMDDKLTQIAVYGRILHYITDVRL